MGAPPPLGMDEVSYRALFDASPIPLLVVAPPN
jgi:hypothetical protein